MTSSKTQLRALRAQHAADRSSPPWRGIAVLGGTVAGVVFALYLATDSWLVAVGIIGFFAIWSRFLSERHERWLGTFATSRVGESICGFARDFPRGSVEPVLLRAVYEGVQGQMGDYRVPIRATSLTSDLHLDADDIDEVYWDIADTCGYETEDGEQNPYRGRVKTVADLVHFLQYQPRSRT